MRKPTEIEINEVLDFFGHERDDEMAFLLNYSVVFDDYMTDCPGYKGKVLMVVYPAYPNMFDCFIWDQGQIKQLEQEK